MSKQFYSGLYSDIATEYIDSINPPPISAEDAVYIGGALCYLGRTSEAESIFKLNFKLMNLDQISEAKFYLIVNLRRQRRKDSSFKARKLLIEILKSIRASKAENNARQLFFFYCGLAFYRFVDARFKLALNWSRKAYDQAFQASFPFGRLVSYDLIGHSQLNIGDVRAGLKNLSNSAAIADSLGRGAIKQAVNVTLRIYKSIYGLDLARNLYAEMQGAIRACSFENSYSLANLHIELARLLPLIGEGHLIEQSLREAGEFVYRLDLPFLDASLSFRYAHLAVLKGEYSKALDLLRTVKVRTSESSDSHMELKVLGLEERVLRKMGKTDEADSLAPNIRRLEARTGAVISRRINNRNKMSESNMINRGEDILGDLIEEVANKSLDSRLQVLSSGFLGLIPNMLDLPPFAEAIVFGFLRESVTVLAKGHVRHDPDGWPDLVKKLFISLGEHRKLTKDDIAEKVWRQSYNPLRHDPLIYALIARARKMLEPYDHWLSVNEGFYSLESTIIVQEVVLTSTTGPSGSHKASQFIRHPDLSVRQSRVLELCEQKGTITNKDVCEAFEVSEVTAGRDLSEMVEKGILQRVGKGRATSYTKS